MTPRLCSALIAGSYALACGAYIIVSSQVAASSSVTVDELAVTETIKGLVFVGVTGALIFGLSYLLARQVERSTEVAARHRLAFLEAEQRATAALLASTIAHDFNNVLTVLASGVHEVAGRAEEDVVVDMRRAIDHGTALARRLSQNGRRSAQGVVARADVVALVHETIGLVRSHRAARDVRFEIVAPAPVTRDVYPSIVQQLVMNLALNAAEATGSKGRVRVSVDARGEGGVRIAVEDDGPGIPEPDRDRVVEAFYTTKDRGTGLGLVSAKACVDMHGGALVLGASGWGGARVVATLERPIALERPDAAA